MNKFPSLIYIPKDIIEWDALNTTWHQIPTIASKLQSTYRNFGRYVFVDVFKDDLKKITRNMRNLKANFSNEIEISTLRAGVYKLTLTGPVNCYMNLLAVSGRRAIFFNKMEDFPEYVSFNDNKLVYILSLV